MIKTIIKVDINLERRNIAFQERAVHVETTSGGENLISY
jgi:hypothetical protein